MNNQRHSIRLILRSRIFDVLAAGIFLIPAARAQRAVDNRCLLIFDISSEMKRRVPAVQKALDNLFVTGMGGQLQPGDSIGVWTFDQDLRTDQFPLQYWVPDEAATMTAGITAFVKKQHYSKTASFGALQPWLNEVVTNSERLTVLIFCDGETAVSGTPYDAGINQLFQQRLAGQKKARQPFIVVLRAQLGQYVGCTVDFPPALVDFPRFPPLPAPPPPPVPTNQPPPSPPPPPVVVPSIIVVGTNPPPAPKPTNTPPVAPVVPMVPVGETNVTAAPPTNTVRQTNAETNPPTNTPPLVAPANMTNAMPSPPENPGLDSRGALAIGAVFLGAAIILGVFIWCRARKTGSSLITRSMNKE